MSIHFQEAGHWDVDRQSLSFWATVNGERVRCLVSREVLDDHFGGGHAGDYVDFFRIHQRAICSLAKQLIEWGQASNGELVVSNSVFN